MGLPSIICYPQPGKAKSRLVCEALAAGADGAVAEPLPDAPAPLASGFYGTVGIEGLFRQARRSGFDWYYADNAYFDVARGTHYRLARNALQDLPPVPMVGATVDHTRRQKLGVHVTPWRRGGRHIVVVMQSPHFLRETAQWPGGAEAWQRTVLATLKRHTDRPIVVRHWSRDKAARAASLRADLDGAWALVTHMSAAANEALLAGVPVFVTGCCAALPMGLSQLESIETPRRPDGRAEWAAALCARQWTLEELAAGEAWRVVNESAR